MSLVALCAGVVALLCGLWLPFPRRKETARVLAESEPAPIEAAAVRPPELAAPTLAALRVAAGRESGDERARESLAGAPAAEDAPATIAGRVILDGRPPLAGGRILFRSDDGTRAGSVLVDHEGRFWLQARPSEELVLSFDLEPSDQRVLLLPEQRIRASGPTTELDLDWRTKHVNLKVFGDGAGGNRAQVDVAGPDCAASIETGDDGRAALTLVGAGLFTFRAVLPSGRRGEATLELVEGTDLDSVVIEAAALPGR